MAISLEELAAATLEGSVGPWTLAVGATALAVALAAGSTRPLRRVAATTSVAAVQQAAAKRVGTLNPTSWLGAARRSWLRLVDEARTEYEAGRQGSTAVTSAIVVASASGVAQEPGTVMIVTAESDAVPSDVLVTDADADEHAESPTRDRRGRFVRRATNGTRPG
ncbi:MAG: hypothetical protein U0893_18520 [Chloroflexota bacterium]